MLTEMLRCLTESSVVRCLPIELLLSATSVPVKRRSRCSRGDIVGSALQATAPAGSTMVALGVEGRFGCTRHLERPAGRHESPKES